MTASPSDPTRVPAGSQGPSTNTHAEGPLSPGQAFGTRYRILGSLGAGGMGAVYKAFDEELGVAVALKVIRPDILSDPAAAHEMEHRFKRELLLAREVTHRNVVRIHDLGEVNGVKYITMPFIDGRTLAEVMAEQGPMPLDRALRIVRQVAEGLLAAHEAGVVHRDLKPENVMLAADEHAIIMDFGISRAIGRTAATATATATGAIVGTLEYMAPEQAGGVGVDQRADIYALGLMLFDMLDGRHRITGAGSAVAEMMNRLQTPHHPHRATTAMIPPQIDDIITKATEADPNKRYQSVAGVLADLDVYEGRGAPRARGLRGARAIAAAGVVLAVAIGAAALTWYFAARRPAPVAPDHPPVSLLIADFDNQTGDPLFRGSLEQALAIAMEGAPFITNYPRASAVAAAAQLGRTAPGDGLDAAAARLVAQREGLKVVLAGSVAMERGAYRLNVWAIDAVPGTELAKASDSAKTKGDVLQAVATVASDIRDQLGDATPQSERLAAAETFTASSLEAARAYAAGQELMSNGKYRDAIVQYRRAVQIDANFGRAYAAWAVSAFQIGDTAEAKRLYTEAFRLVDRMTEREQFRTYCGYYLTVAENYPKAIESCGRLVTEYPSDRAGHSNLALAYFYTLNFPKVLEHGRRAIEIYRGSPKFRSNYALYAMYAGDFTTGASVARALLADVPSYYRAYLPIATAAVSAGDIAGARAAYERMAAIDGQGASLASIGQADLAMYGGDVDLAIRLLVAGIGGDIRLKNTAALAAKRVALAEAYMTAGDSARAQSEATAAVALSATPAVLFPAARVLAATGRAAEASKLASTLATHVQPEHRAYAKLIDAEVAISGGRPADYGAAASAAVEAQRLADMWLARRVLGEAYVRAEAFGDAVPELQACLKRRGEASAVFLDDQPSVRYLPPVYYWLARAQEGLGLREQAVANYKTFLSFRPEPSRDPLAGDARTRIR